MSVSARLSDALKRRPLRSALVALAVLVMLLLASVVMLLYTETGRKSLARYIEESLSTPGEIEIDFDRLHGALPANIQIDRITVADRNGPWLTIADTELNWRPLALLGGRLQIDAARAREIVVLRRPEPSARPVQAEDRPGVSLPPVRLALEKLTVDELRIDEPVAGETARLTFSGSATALQDRATARLAVERLDGKPGRANAELAWNEVAESLDIEAVLSEPADGLVARLLGLPGRPAIDFSITGDGSAGDWRGQVDLRAGALLTLTSGLLISVDPAFQLVMQGSVSPGEMLGPEAGAILGPNSEFDLVLARDAAQRDWSVDLRNIRSRTLVGRGAVTIDAAAAQIDGTLELSTLDSKPLAGMIKPAEFTSASARADFKGVLTHPVVRAETVAEGFVAEGFAAKRVELDVTLSPDRPLTSPDVHVSIDSVARFDGLETPSPELDGLLGLSPRITVAGARLEGFANLETGAVTVAGDKADASLTGDVALDSGVLNASGKVGISDIASLSGAAGRTLGGRLQADFTIGRQADDAVDLSLDGILADAALEQPMAERLLGPKVRFSGAAQRLPDGSLVLTDLALSGDGIDANAGLTLRGETDWRLEADYEIGVSDLEALGLADPAKAGGSLSLAGKAAGPAADPAIDGSLSLSAAAPGGMSVRQLDAQYFIRRAVTAPQGEFRLTGASELLPDLAGKTGFRLADKVLTLTDLELSARGTAAEGNLVIPLDGRPVGGELSLRSSDVAPWSDVAGRKLAGRIDGRVRLQGDGTVQNAVLTMAAVGAALDEQVSSRRLDLDMTATDILGEPVLKGSIRGGMQFGPAEARKLSMRLEGPLKDMAFRLQASGQLRARELALDANGRLARNKQRTMLSIASLSGTAVDIPVRLRRPARVELEPAIDSGDIDLAVGEGALLGRYRQADGKVSLEASVREVPLAALWPSAPPQFDGSSVDVDASLDGPVTGPAGTLELAVTGLAAGESEGARDGLTLQLQGKLAAGRLTASGRVDGLAGVSANAAVALPARLSLAPAAFTVDENTPLTGEVVYRGPILPGWALMGLDRHRLEGQGDIAIALSGMLGAPRVSGHVALSDGRYENYDTGTILTDMQFTARPSADTITIDRATAKDGGDGEISLTGGIGFGGDELLTMDMEATLDNARLIRRDELSARASGRLALRGDLQRRKVSGRLEIGEAEIRLAGGLPPDIVEIPVEETGTPPAGAARAKPPAKPSRTDLDLDIAMPKRVFVRGRGLDSEWGGELSVTGTTAAPRVQGALRPLRGRYDFVGRIFTLRDGSIAFAGKDEIDPALDLSAERRATDLTAIVHVTGTAKQPVVTLESIPEYPQDEVLSRLLFNKSTGRLSAAEAVQLAQAVGTLTGATDGGGIMDFARGMLNLDVLSFEGKSEESEGGAEAGKYVTDEVYLGVEGTATGETGVTVEIEITPRLKLEGDIGPQDKSKTGLKWKRDY